MDTETLQEYLSNKYQGPKSFLKNIIFPIFGEEMFEDEYETEYLKHHPERLALAKSTGVELIKQVGKIYVGATPLQIFDITVSDRVMMERNRVNTQKLIRSIMDQYSCAFMIFHYTDASRWDWRFSYCHKGGNNEEFTDSKRYTFLLGPDQSCRTATENFMTLYEKRDHVQIDDIEMAFNVEALSKEFFTKYKDHYTRFVEYMINTPVIRQDFIDRNFDHANLSEEQIRDREEKPIRDYVKKLLGRIVFLHFLQKKGWLGVPEDKEWGEGDRNFMLHLFEYASDEQKDNFLDNVLEPLFDDALDNNRSNKKDMFDTRVDGFNKIRIPYLNGGLFERDALDEKTCRFPSKLFNDLLTMFSQYNFTIDENDPNDAEVGIDPEMLGRIFENLLEDNRDRGAYYTPKEIVQYMCRESLIAYLQTDQTENNKEIIRQFVLTHDAEQLPDNLKAVIDDKLKEVKICDPAIGSGAFPMGLLRELFYCRSAIEPDIVDDAANIKRHIIQNNIYGVDIERGAVDIARLRFWLSLVVDEKSPITLPNLDFKIMQGNSLLEQYKRVDLSTLMARKTETYNKIGVQTIIFDDELDIMRKQLFDKMAEYYGCDNHTERVKLREEITKMVQAQIETQRYSIDNIDIYANDQFFLWHTWFSDVFSSPSKGGFDIVIGNPPYIQLENNGGELATLYENCNFKSFARTGDIYCLFYERGYQLLKPGGHLCFITSNKWMRAGYGENTRNFFANYTNPKLLIDFAGVRIFESATVDTNILLFSKSANEHKTLCAVTDKQNKNGIKNLGVFVEQQHTVCGFSNNDKWLILSPIEQSIKQKIEAVGTPLKDWDIQINYGIKTGCNEAFIISTEKRNEILANCKTKDERTRTAELIRPILRGRDIKRYGYDWANLWLINTHNGIRGKFPRVRIEEYPAIKAHLDQYWNKISQRADKGDTPYNLRNCAYLEDFYKPKIMYSEIVREPQFYLDIDTHFFPEATTFIITGKHLEYLTDILNSSIFAYFFKTFYAGGGLGENGYRYKKKFLENLPVTKPIHPYTSINEAFIYKLYHFTPDEIKFIESQQN